MKSLLLFPDGIGLRNFVLTRFLSLLLERGEVVIAHALPERTIQAQQERYKQVRWFALPRHAEGTFPYLFRRAKQMAQLYWQNEPGTDVILKQTLGKGHGLRRLRGIFAEQLGRMAASDHAHVLRLHKLHLDAVQAQPYFKTYLNLLRQYAPDFVFCSHQRSELAVPLMLAAQHLGIPAVTFIYSWDNLPKGRMAVPADYYLVWSEHMRAEMRQYYPDIPDQRIFIVGTPQFEHYFCERNWQSKQDFFSKYGLDPAKPVICFSGDDTATSPHDPDYLEDVALAVKGFAAENRPQIIFRRTPTDISGRYASVLARYPHIVSIEPAWVNLADNDWTKVIPTEDDVSLLVNTVRHSDLVINVGSTMALDFAINHKPAIYINYNPSSLRSGETWNIEDVYRHPHFNHLPQFSPLYWANRPEDLPSLIQMALDYPAHLDTQRRAWVDFLTQTPLEQASERGVAALSQIVVDSKLQ